MRNFIIKMLKTYLDYTYKAADNKLLRELQDDLLHARRDSNKWQGKASIYYQEIVKLNRSVFKKARMIKKHKTTIIRLKLKHPEVFEEAAPKIAFTAGKDK